MLRQPGCSLASESAWISEATLHLSLAVAPGRSPVSLSWKIPGCQWGDILVFTSTRWGESKGAWHSIDAQLSSVVFLPFPSKSLPL